MAKHFYAGVLYPAGDDGLYGVFVPGVNVMGSGPTADDAMADAAEILQEYCDNLADKGEMPELPVPVSEINAEDGQLIMLPALMPAEQARVNIMMDAVLVKRIDAVAPNRSAFLSAAARSYLAMVRAEMGKGIDPSQALAKRSNKVAAKRPNERRHSVDA